MASKYLLILWLFFTVSSTNAQLQAVNRKIKITVGTTAGCGDTVNFILNQLDPAYAQYKEFLEVEFVPWGRTRRNADGSLTCQYGVNDCFANRVHRCVLDMLECDQDAQIRYMKCEFTSPRPAFLQGSYSCAHAAGISLIKIDYCVSVTGGDLDVAAEEAAQEPMSVINLVPSIHFNDVIDVNLHNQARTRLSSLICFALAADSSTGVKVCQI